MYNNNENQQAYDRGVSVFSPEGRLYQVEYAREAVKRGAPGVGIRTEDSVVLASKSGERSSLVVTESIEKVHKIENDIGSVSAGYTPDGRRLVDQLRLITQKDQIRYGDLAPVNVVSQKIADHLQESTQVGGRRPYGASLIIAGVDETGPRVFEVEPGGTPTEYHAVAEGQNRRQIMEYFENEYDSELSTEEAIQLAADALNTFSDGGINKTTLDVAVISEDESFNQLSTDEVAEYCEEE